MEAVEQEDAGSYHADSRRRSRRRWLIWLALLVFVPAMIWYAVIGDNPAARSLSVALSVVLVLATFFGRFLLWGSEPLLTLSDRGIHSFQLRLHDRFIAWDAIEDADTEGVDGRTMWLRLTVRPEAIPRPETKPFFASSLRTPGIFIGDLAEETQARLVGTIVDKLNGVRHVRGDTAEIPSVARDRVRQEFNVRLDALTPTPWMVYLLAALNIVIWIANVISGVHFYQPTPADLYAWGGNATSSVVLDGEAWRLVSSVFLHSGIEHLLLNLFALAIPGVFLCRWVGNARFLLIYVLCGLVGSAWSLHFSSTHHISVGASGAVIGVVGAIIGSSFRLRARMPRNLVAAMVAVVVVTLLEGLLDPQIDMAAHVGALLVGFGMGLVLIDRTGWAATRRRLALESCGLIVFACLAVSLLAVTADTKGAVNMGVLFGAGRQANALLGRFDALETRIVRDAEFLESGRIDQAVFDSRMDDANIPAYEVLVAEMATIAVEPGRPSTRYWSLMKQNKSTRLSLLKLSRLVDHPGADKASVEGQVRELQTVLIVENVLIKRIVIL